MKYTYISKNCIFHNNEICVMCLAPTWNNVIYLQQNSWCVEGYTLKSISLYHLNGVRLLQLSILSGSKCSKFVHQHFCNILSKYHFHIIRRNMSSKYQFSIDSCWQRKRKKEWLKCLQVVGVEEKAMTTHSSILA